MKYIFLCLISFIAFLLFCENVCFNDRSDENGEGIEQKGRPELLDEIRGRAPLHSAEGRLLLNQINSNDKLKNLDIDLFYEAEKAQGSSEGRILLIVKGSRRVEDARLLMSEFRSAFGSELRSPIRVVFLSDERRNSSVLFMEEIQKNSMRSVKAPG